MPTRDRVAKAKEAADGGATTAASPRYSVRRQFPAKCKDGKVRMISPALAAELPTLLPAKRLEELTACGLLAKTE